jgi:hypothetical protein
MYERDYFSPRAETKLRICYSPSTSKHLLVVVGVLF